MEAPIDKVVIDKLLFEHPNDNGLPQPIIIRVTKDIVTVPYMGMVCAMLCLGSHQDNIAYTFIGTATEKGEVKRRHVPRLLATFVVNVAKDIEEDDEYKEYLYLFITLLYGVASVIEH